MELLKFHGISWNFSTGYSDSIESKWILLQLRRNEEIDILFYIERYQQFAEYQDKRNFYPNYPRLPQYTIKIRNKRYVPTGLVSVRLHHWLFYSAVY